jgi:2-polyprenyl-3-methyl-5-hydroxy-6-metoxy-1,4-benzoquinol methylase
MSQVEFAKYVADGAYHWDAASSSLTKHVAFTSGRYAAVLQQPVRWAGATVLDIACGDARLSAYVAQAGAKMIVGADLSHIGISVGRRRWMREQPDCIHRASFVQADGLSLPVAASTFDVVIASEIIEHVDDAETFLIEASRPLKNDGALIVTTPYRLTEKPIDPHHTHEYFPGELESLMKHVFNDVHITLTHPAWVASLYTLHGWAEPFRWLVNALAVMGSNPFLSWPIGRYAAQITALGRRPVR